MKTPLFHRAMYRQTLRQFRVVGITMLMLFTVFEEFSLLVSGDWFPINFHYGFVSFHNVHPSLIAIPYVVPFILTLFAFQFQSSRRESDFYHSLPITKKALSFTQITAVVTWSAIVVFGSSLVIGTTAMFCHIGDPTSVAADELVGVAAFIASYLLPALGDIALKTLACFAACLFVTMLTFLSAQLSGNTISTALTTAILLAAPHFILFTLTDCYVGNVPILPSDYRYSASLNLGSYNLLYGNSRSIAAWIVTLAMTVVLFLLGMRFASRRASETAGKAGSTNAVQIILRTLLALTCSMPAISTIIDDGFFVDFAVVGVIYLGVIAVYFLFELFTTRKPKALIGAAKWLLLVLLLNVMCIVGVNLAIDATYSYQPDPDEIESVSVVHIGELYKDDEIRLTDEKTREIVSTALKAAAEHYAAEDYIGYCEGYKCSYAIHKMYNQYFIAGKVDIIVHSGLFTHHRSIYLDEDDLTHLNTMVNRLKKEV